MLNSTPSKIAILIANADCFEVLPDIETLKVLLINTTHLDENNSNYVFTFNNRSETDSLLAHAFRRIQPHLPITIAETCEGFSVIKTIKTMNKIVRDNDFIMFIRGQKTDPVLESSIQFAIRENKHFHVLELCDVLEIDNEN